MADPPKPVGAGRLQRIQHGLDPVAQLQVGVADDGRRCPAGAVETAGAGGGLTLHKFYFADGSQLFGAFGAVHRPCLNEHGGTHVVAAVDVRGQLVEQIPLVGDPLAPVVPQVMVGIADGDLRLQCGFRGQCQPVIASEWHDGASFMVYCGTIISHHFPPEHLSPTPSMGQRSLAMDAAHRPQRSYLYQDGHKRFPERG